MHKYAPWIGLALLIIIVLILLQRFRSGYTPSAGEPITLMDLQEFSAFTPEQKAKYVNTLKEYDSKLMIAAQSKSVNNYRMFLDEIMNKTMVAPETPPMPPSTPSPAPPPMPPPAPPPETPPKPLPPPLPKK